MNNMYKLSLLKTLLLLAIFGLSINNSKAQFIGGQTYVVNGASDVVAPVDTFANLMGSAFGPAYGAISFLNQFGISPTTTGAVNLILSPGYSGNEPTVVTIGTTTGGYPNMRNDRPVVIKSAPGFDVTITTPFVASNSGLVRFNGSWFVTIDGEGTPGQRNITFRMVSASLNTRVIDVAPTASQAVQGIIVRNCNIYGNSTSSSNNTFAGIYVGGSATTPQAVARGRNENMTFENNYIVAVQNGIYHRGLASTSNNQDRFINVRNNIIGDTVNVLAPTSTARIGGGNASCGIYMNAVSQSNIENNIIRFCLPNSTNFQGIFLTHEGGLSSTSTDSAITVIRNRIHDLNVTSTGGAYGVRINLGSHPNKKLNILVANNSIRNISSTGAQSVVQSFIYPVGILVENTTNNAGIEIFYNTVIMGGNTLPANAISANVGIGAGVTGGVAFINNLLSNTMGKTLANNNGYTIYNVVLAGTINPFLYSSFNNYHNNTLDGGYNYVARANNIDYGSLVSYRTYSVSDSSSWTAIPPAFDNISVATIANNVRHRIWNRGVDITQLWRFYPTIFNEITYKPNNDMLGNLRNNLGRFASIGCHQWNATDSSGFNISLTGPRTFAINGTDNFPITGNFNGSFATLSSAIEYLNAYGIAGTGNIFVEFQTGYSGEPGYLPIIKDYDGANAGRLVTIRPAIGINVNLSIPAGQQIVNNGAVIRFQGCKWLTIDGRPGRNITFSLPPTATNAISRVIGITPTATPTQELTISNCNIFGNSTATTINTQFGVYIGAPITTGTPLPALVNGINRISITDCDIEAVRTGIHARVPGNSQELYIRRNIIGGEIPTGGIVPTTYIGGAADQAGVFVKGYTNVVIDSNTIKNCIQTSNISNGFRGVDLDEPGSNNFANITVSKNLIYNLVTLSGNYTIGVRLLLSSVDTNNTRNIFIQNNYIGRIIGNGSGSNFSTFNPAGIVIDAAGVMPRPGINIAHNTVNLTGTGLAIANSSSAALFVSANIRGGVAMVNNIFANQMNRATAGNKYAVLVGHTETPFNAANTLLPFGSNNNNYFLAGAGNNFIGGHAGGTVNRFNINDWRLFTRTSSPQSDGNSFSWLVTFLSDTTPFMNMATAGLVPNSAAFLSLICDDVFGNQRFQCAGSNTTGRWVGALESGNLSPALRGGKTYQINGVENPPLQSNPDVGSFRTVRSAVNYLNSQGVDGSFGGVSAVRLEISTGYVGETDSFVGPITISDYPRQNANRPVILTVADGQNHTIAYAGPAISAGLIANASFIRFSGTQFFIIDGSNNGSTSRNLTIQMPAALNQPSNKVIDIISGAATIQANNPATSNNTIRNCIIRGNATTFSNQNFAAIYAGGISATPSNALVGNNNNNTFRNNQILAVQNGIYLRGTNTRGLQDFGAVIANNEIGGNTPTGSSSATDYFGGINGAAGISLIAQANSSITGNIVKNNIPGFTQPKGIELQTIAGQNTVLDSNITISGNNIYRITSTAANGAYGIYVNFGNDSLNARSPKIRIINNMISAISSAGSSRTTSFNLNPYGIYFDAAVNVSFAGNTDVDVNIAYNSVNLGLGSTMASFNAISACLGIDQRFRGGFDLVNNIFQNRLGGSLSATNATAVAIGGTNDPIETAKRNNYFAAAPAPTVNANYMSSASLATPVLYNLWNEIMGFTLEDSLATTFSAPFFSDTTLTFVTPASNVFVGSGAPTNFANTDFFGTPRSPFAPSVGAQELPSADGNTYTDIIPPRIFNVTEQSNCNPGFAVFTIRHYDAQMLRDTFYYRINGGAVTAIQGTGSYPEKTYILANLPTGAVIEYRISGRDFSNNVGVFPLGKIWDTINTNVAVYPYTNNFDGANSPRWTVQTISGNATWDITAFGSAANPPIGPRSGQRTALFASSNFTNGATARLMSPCFDFSNTVSPTLRFFMSQNSDLPNKRDSVIIRVSAGGGFWSNPIRNIRRINDNFNFPGYTLVEVCLSEYNGFSSLRIGIDGVSSGNGHNIVIDDITVYDDAQLQTFTPKVFSQCFRNAVSLNIPGSSTSHLYEVIDAQTNDIVASGNGNGSTLNLQFLPPNRDQFRFTVRASNQVSFAIRSGFGSPFVTCANTLPDTVTANVNRFFNGPFVIPGSPFNGSFNGGGAFDPDGAKVGDTLVYRINPPGNQTNAQYGTTWTVSNHAIQSANGTNLPYTFTAPSGSGNGSLRIIVPQNALDSSYFVTLTIRLLESNCDSLVQRILRIATPPQANFVNTPANNACALTPVLFQSVSTLVPENFPYTYLWLFGDNTTSTVVNPSKTYQTPGDYLVRLIVTDRFGLTSQFTRTITVLPAPIVNNFTFTTPCSGDSTLFNSGSQAAGSNYLWTFPGNITDTRQTGKFNFPNFDQSYQVSLRVTNPQGCANTATRTIFVFAKPRAKFTSSAHCLATNVPVTDSTTIGNNNALGYVWVWGNGETSLGPNPVYKYKTSGTFNATLKVSSSFGCTDSFTVPVTVFDKPNTNFTFSNACKDDEIVLNNNTTYSGGAQNLDYIWDFGDNTFSNQRLPKKSFISVGTYQIRLTAVDKLNGCRDSLRIPVTVNYKPVAQFNSAVTVCENSPLALFNNSYTIDQSQRFCFWNFGNGDTSTDCAKASYTYKAHNNYTLRLIVFSANGACSDTAEKAIVVNVSPVLDIFVNRADTTLPSFFYGKNKIKFTSSISNGIDYTWRFGDALSSSSKQVEPTFVYNNKGTYKVRLKV